LSAPDPTNLLQILLRPPFLLDDPPNRGSFFRTLLALGVTWPIIMGITMWFQNEAQPYAGRPTDTQRMIFDWIEFPADLHLHLLGRASRRVSMI